MPKVAIGVFQNPVSANAVIEDLENDGVARSDVRTIAEPVALAEEPAVGSLESARRDSAFGMSTAHTDFELDVVRELMAIGVRRDEAQTYREGLRRGGVLVIARGSDDQVDVAAETMNRCGALHVEELVHARGAPGVIPEAHPAKGEFSFPEPGIQAGRDRSSSGGARVFVW